MVAAAKGHIIDRRICAAVQFVPLGPAIADPVEAQSLESNVESFIDTKLVELVVAETGGGSEIPGRMHERRYVRRCSSPSQPRRRGRKPPSGPRVGVPWGRAPGFRRKPWG